MAQQVILTDNIADGVSEVCRPLNADNIVSIADSNTAAIAHRLGHPVITVETGENHKTIDTVSKVWDRLHDMGLTRHSAVVNVGGGMITDLGGFAAATYRRGIAFINVPTTLLGAVDAASGGKTGVNHSGVKNHVGVFAEARAVVVCPKLFTTLPSTELLSGYAEMLKHALIKGGDALDRLRLFDPRNPKWPLLGELVSESIEVKRGVVAADPHESHLRKVLNLGHTAGHAFEELALERNTPIPHGYAVAYGLAVALVLSVMMHTERSDIKALSDLLHNVTSHIRELYGAPHIGCADYDRLYELMLDDKKNRHDGNVRFVLLKEAGNPWIDVPVDKHNICAAMDITRDMLGI